jgi:predicted metal-dependent peptidase
MPDFAMRLERIRSKLLIQLPLLGFMLQKVDIVLSLGIRTAATDGKIIYLDPVFVESICEEELMFLLLHELLHMVLRHPSRILDRNLRTYNIACDVVVNDILLEQGFPHGSLSPVHGSEFEVDGSKYSVEEVYEWIPKDKTVVLLDLHGLWGDGESKSISNGTIDGWIIEANQNGWIRSAQSFLRTLVEHGFHSPNQQRLDAALEKILVKQQPDYTYQRTDRRFQPILLPDFVVEQQTIERAWFVLDASMSISNQTLLTMVEDVRRLFWKYPLIQCYLSFFSTEVSEPMAINDQESVEQALHTIPTTGGTSFYRIFQCLNRCFPHEKPKIIFILTDGHARFPNEESALDIKTMWLMYRSMITAPFGDTIWIDE